MAPGSHARDGIGGPPRPGCATLGRGTNPGGGAGGAGAATVDFCPKPWQWRIKSIPDMFGPRAAETRGGVGVLGGGRRDDRRDDRRDEEGAAEAEVEVEGGGSGGSVSSFFGGSGCPCDSLHPSPK